jgi:K(+)-stimulated pyrophosphate-energized sodium pump
MLTFGMGASTQALFARVGGGIYTKAADVGADLVGKVEAGIPEDDPRNPATIADNVGDNVGDVAGMGADLYESYAGAILATSALGAAAYSAVGGEIQEKAVLAPMLIASVGVVLSLIGIFLVRTKEGASMKELLGSLGKGTNISSILVGIATFGILYALNIENWLGLSFSVVVGLTAGVIIGQATEYYTSHTYSPTQKVAKSSETGPATVIISGLGLGMISTAIPVITIGAAIILSYLCAIGFDLELFFTAKGLSLGLYGIGIAAVGMLSTLGITLATDAYGPIADNAGGNAEMSELGKEVRSRTDALDALGNTTAATGKGFAIGSAALTALALFVSYAEAVKLSAINMLDPRVIIGLLIGGMLPFLFSAFTMESVGRAANQMIEEVRRQFKEKPGILAGTEKPDYKTCVSISTKAALKEMIVPGLIAVAAPLLCGFILGPTALGGMLGGSLVTGVLMAIFMANSGGAWDNAKKYIETGHHGGKGSEAHHAAVVGDTVGDPFKDTSGPSINILIKLMTVVSTVFAAAIAAVGGIFG